MSNRKQDWIQWIRQYAAKYHVDPQAALAVASREGLGGGVGDQGTSFGPFQLHEGGALPRGRGQAWAESPAGVEYALRQIGQVAGGQHGQTAVRNIVSRFERPADPAGEIAGAIGALGQFGGAANAAAAPVSPGPAPGLQASAPETSPVAAMLLKQLQGGGDVNFMALAAANKQPARQAQKVTHAQGPNVPATPGAAGLVGIAAKQLGQPYVWGGESRKEGGFDCSGLVDWSMRQQGYNGPRLTTYSIAKLGQSVKGHPLQPGDLVLANHGEHVVIYAGHGKVIAAPHTGTRVQYQPLSKFNITDVRRV